MRGVRFPSGHEIWGSDWRDVLHKWNLLPWNIKWSSEQMFKGELAYRAYVWCGRRKVEPNAPLAQFFEQLERAKMLERIGKV